MSDSEESIKVEKVKINNYPKPFCNAAIQRMVNSRFDNIRISKDFYEPFKSIVAREFFPLIGKIAEVTASTDRITITESDVMFVLNKPLLVVNRDLNDVDSLIATAPFVAFVKSLLKEYVETRRMNLNERQIILNEYVKPRKTHRTERQIDKFRFSKDALISLKIYAQEFSTRLLIASGQAALHADRVTIKASDLSFARKICATCSTFKYKRYEINK
jgi:histone H3/H4